MDADFGQNRSSKSARAFSGRSFNDLARGDFIVPIDIQACVRWIHNPCVTVLSASPQPPTESQITSSDRVHASYVSYRFILGR